MSRAGGPSEIGAASIGIHADTSALPSELKGAEAQVAASAAKMEAASKVRLFTDPASQAAANRGAAANAAGSVGAATEKTGQSLREGVNSATLFTRSLGRITGAAFAVVHVMDAVQKGIDFARTSFGNGAKAAEEFYKKIGGAAVGTEDASKKLKQIQERLLEVNSELARAQEQPWIFRGGRQLQTIRQDLERLLEINKTLSQQAANGERARRRAELEEKKAESKEFNDEFDAEARTRERERAEESSRRENESHNEKMRHAEQLGRAALDAADPFGAIQRSQNEQLRTIAQFRSEARNKEERDLADMWERAVIEGGARGIKALKDQFQNMITEAMNDAIQGQVGQFGLQNLTVQMSQLNMKADAIKQAIPRRWK